MPFDKLSFASGNKGSSREPPGFAGAKRSGRAFDGGGGGGRTKNNNKSRGVWRKRNSICPFPAWRQCDRRAVSSANFPCHCARKRFRDRTHARGANWICGIWRARYARTCHAVVWRIILCLCARDLFIYFFFPLYFSSSSCPLYTRAAEMFLPPWRARFYHTHAIVVFNVLYVYIRRQQHPASSDRSPSERRIIYKRCANNIIYTYII